MIQRHSLRDVPVCEDYVRLIGQHRFRGQPAAPAQRAAHARGRGLTFIELLIGLSITATTCGILAALIGATAMGTTAQTDGRRELVRLQTLKATLEDEFVNARCILATGPNYVVYWTGDSATAVTPVNSAVNLSELRLLAIDASGNLNIYACKWPAGASNATILANDTTYAASSNWYPLAEGLIGTTYYATNVIAANATSLTASLDNASPTAAKYIALQIVINDGTVTRNFALGVTLANPGAPW